MSNFPPRPAPTTVRELECLDTRRAKAPHPSHPPRPKHERLVQRVRMECERHTRATSILPRALYILVAAGPTTTHSAYSEHHRQLQLVHSVGYSPNTGYTSVYSSFVLIEN